MGMITVKDLAYACEQQIKKGNGDKIVLVTDDEEANGYHALFYYFNDNKKDINDMYDAGLFRDCNADEAILIG